MDSLELTRLQRSIGNFPNCVHGSALAHPPKFNKPGPGRPKGTETIEISLSSGPESCVTRRKAGNRVFAVREWHDSEPPRRCGFGHRVIGDSRRSPTRRGCSAWNYMSDIGRRETRARP